MASMPQCMHITSGLMQAPHAAARPVSALSASAIVHAILHSGRQYYNNTAVAFL
jgi:hypothetical protein